MEVLLETPSRPNNLSATATMEDEEYLPFAVNSIHKDSHKKPSLETTKFTASAAFSSFPSGSPKPVEFGSTSSRTDERTIESSESTTSRSTATATLSSSSSDSRDNIVSSGPSLHSISHHLDAVASLLLPASSLVDSENKPILASSSTDRHQLEHSVAFSTLLRRADDRFALSVVKPTAENQEKLQQDATPTLHRKRPLNTARSSMMQQTIVPAAAVDSTESRIASLAGASAKLTSNSSFQVTVDVTSPDASSVMSVLGNPHLLTSWCDSVPAMIITSTSEGAGSSNHERQYEGEWIEATASQLVPPSGTSCLYHTRRAVQAAMGFPIYGKVTMFVERQRGQVGVTLGPFPGDLYAYYQMAVQSISNTRVRIQSHVHVRPIHEQETESLWNRAHGLFRPKINDYMGQVLSSMARLRFLVENEETNVGYVPPSLAANALNTPLLDTVSSVV